MIIKTFLNAGLFIAILLSSPFQACSFTVEIRGGEAASFLPPLPKDKAVSDKTRLQKRPYPRPAHRGGGAPGARYAYSRRMDTPAQENEHVSRVARQAVDRMLELYNPLLKERWNTAIDVLSVETNRWPFSVHVAKPGHFSKQAKILRRPLGRIFFANNNIGTPSFEEALFRGHCAANNVLNRIDKDFTQESWSNCPLEP